MHGEVALDAGQLPTEEPQRLVALRSHDVGSGPAPSFAGLKLRVSLCVRMDPTLGGRLPSAKASAARETQGYFPRVGTPMVPLARHPSHSLSYDLQGCSPGHGFRGDGAAVLGSWAAPGALIGHLGGQLPS